MSLHKYLLMMAFGTIAAWIAWFIVIHGIDPKYSDMLGHLLFYSTFFIALIGSFTLLGILVRMWRKRDAFAPIVVMRSFRQGILFSTLVATALFLFSQGWFTWWSAFLIIVILTFIEMTFLSSRSN